MPVEVVDQPDNIHRSEIEAPENVVLQERDREDMQPGVQVRPVERLPGEQHLEGRLRRGHQEYGYPNLTL